MDKKNYTLNLVLVRKNFFGITELNEDSDLEARDIRIIAFVDDFLSKLAENSIHTTPLLLKPSIKA